MIISLDTKEAIFSKKCTATGEIYRITVDASDYAKWEGGLLIQDVWPDMSKENREFIKSGTTPSEWSKMFSGNLFVSEEEL